MNRAAHWLSLFSGVCHLLIGIPEMLRLGPRFLPASWSLIYSVLPEWLEWLWPGMFVFVGISAVLGARSVRAMHAGFIVSGLIYWIWGTVSIYGWVTNQGGTIPGSVSYFLLAGTFWLISYYVFMARQIEVKIGVIAEKLTA